MPHVRKKWSTTLIGWRKSHPSMAAAYRYAQDVGEDFRAGMFGACRA